MHCSIDDSQIHSLLCCNVGRDDNMDVQQEINMTQQSRNFAMGQLESCQWSVGTFEQAMTKLLDSAMQSVAKQTGLD